jgi:N-methylhydantoinase B
MPVGHGGTASADGANAMMQHISNGRISPVEVLESRNPWLVKELALAADTPGAGRHRGGLGFRLSVRALEPMTLASGVERTKIGAAGLAGGLTGTPNRACVRLPDGTVRPFRMEAGVEVPAGAVVEIVSGGGGGFGPPEERDPEAILEDLLDGYLTEAFSARHFPRVSEVARKDDG